MKTSFKPELKKNYAITTLRQHAKNHQPARVGSHIHRNLSEDPLEGGRAGAFATAKAPLLWKQ